MFNFFKKHFEKTPENLPDFWKSYLAHFEKNRAADPPSREVRYVVFDTETTGLDLKKDRICEIGAVAVRDKTIELKDFFNTLVIQESGGVGEVKEIHGLRDKVIKTGLEEREAVIQFIEYLEDAVIVAHHAAFDVGMINQSLKRFFGSGLKLKNKVLDTALLERKLNPISAYAMDNPHKYSLDAVSEKYGVALHDRHTAIGDAYITAQVFLKIAARLEKRGNKAF